MKPVTIDIHAHHVPPAVLAALEKRPREYPGVALLWEEDGGCRFAFDGRPPTRPLRQDMRDLDAQRRWMKEQGVDHQLLATWLDIAGYTLPPGAAARWSQLLNETLAEVAAADRQRFSTVASAPIQHGQTAAEVLRRAANLGHRAVMIPTSTPGRELDDRDLDPFWAAAVETGLPVLVHPVFRGDDPRLRPWGLPNIVGRAAETALAATRFLYGGVLKRFPDLRVVWLHGGGFLPYQIGRVDRGYALDAQLREALGAPPSRMLRQCYFDHIVFEPRALRFLCDLVGTEQVMLGSDYPFPVGDLEPLAILERGEFSAEEQRLIRAGNAHRLFGLEGRAHAVS